MSDDLKEIERSLSDKTDSIVLELEKYRDTADKLKKEKELIYNTTKDKELKSMLEKEIQGKDEILEHEGDLKLKSECIFQITKDGNYHMLFSGYIFDNYPLRVIGKASDFGEFEVQGIKNGETAAFIDLISKYNQKISADDEVKENFIELLQSEADNFNENSTIRIIYFIENNPHSLDTVKCVYFSYGNTISYANLD